jgi:hypothetical protein
LRSQLATQQVHESAPVGGKVDRLTDPWVVKRGYPDIEEHVVGGDKRVAMQLGRARLIESRCVFRNDLCPVGLAVEHGRHLLIRFPVSLDQDFVRKPVWACIARPHAKIGIAH